MFAIATGVPGSQLVNSYPLPDHATVKIVDATGHVYAQASFVPPPTPVIGNAAPLLQSPVRTAGGAVFYADRTGAVHRLKPDGSTSVVATFPLSNAQQELGYAVSPDGLHLIATVFSTPPLHNPPPQTLGDPIYQEGGHWTLKLETADAGGTTTTTLQRDLGTSYPSPTTIVGWDKGGPLATTLTQLGAQQATPSAHLFGRLIHLAPDGTHLDTPSAAPTARRPMSSRMERSSATRTGSSSACAARAARPSGKRPFRQTTTTTESGFHLTPTRWRRRASL
jgi:hypothetical protein